MSEGATHTRPPEGSLDQLSTNQSTVKGPLVSKVSKIWYFIKLLD